MTNEKPKLSKPPEPSHLGDGAYVSADPHVAGIQLTANDHRPLFATDRVFLDPVAVKNLRLWLDQYEKFINQ